MTESTLTVSGMSCGHCASSVTEELTKIAGVEKVDVDLGSGQVVVTSENPVSADALRDAISEAGYQLVP